MRKQANKHVCTLLPPFERFSLSLSISMYVCMYVRSLFDACAPANYVCAASVRAYLSDLCLWVCICGELGTIVVSAIIVNAIILSALYIYIYIYMGDVLSPPLLFDHPAIYKTSWQRIVGHHFSNFSKKT